LIAIRIAPQVLDAVRREARRRGLGYQSLITAGLAGLRYASAYVASKHGVVGITKTAALEYAQRGSA
jgi:NAD(P)-dependent dehydrogenase (short-subunit alcohol dehydrogenase family)